MNGRNGVHGWHAQLSVEKELEKETEFALILTLGGEGAKKQGAQKVE